MSEREDNNDADGCSLPPSSVINKKPTIIRSAPKLSAGLSVKENEYDGESASTTKHSGQLKPLKPTIIRPHSKLQPSGDLMTSTPDVTTVPAPITQSSPAASSLGSSSFHVVSQSLPAHSIPNTKPSSMGQAVVSSESQMSIHLAAEKKPLPPARPSFRPQSDISSQKPISGQTVENKLAGQPVPTQVNVSTANKMPVSNRHQTVVPSTLLQSPKRPSGPPPHTNVVGNNKSNTQIEVSVPSMTGADKQFYQAEAKTSDVNPSRMSQMEIGNVTTDKSENAISLPKPKPKPKPRPITITSSTLKDGIKASPVESGESYVSKQLSPSRRLVQHKAHDTKQDVLSDKSQLSPATTAVDKIDQGEDYSANENARHLSTVCHARVDPSKAEKANVKPSAIPSTSSHQDYRLQSASSDPQPTHVLQPLSVSTGELDILPTRPPCPENHVLGSNQPKSKSHENPPPRPATSAPVRLKSMFVCEKPPDNPHHTSSLSDVDRLDLTQPPQPAAYRVKQHPAGVPSLPNRPGPGHPLYSYIRTEPHGVALHDYTARQPDELSFSAGDIVILVKEIDDDWIVGQVKDNVGMYPAAFVEVICPFGKQKSNYLPKMMDSQSVPVNTSSDGLTGPRCRARFDFDGDGEGELTLEDGDIIQITERVGSEWLRGQHRGRQGIFPSSFVEIIEDLPSGDSTVVHNMLPSCVSALFDFHGKDGELSFKAGDTVTVISQVNSEWLFGDCNGEKGQFPSSFVTHTPANVPECDLDQSTQSKRQQMPEHVQNENIQVSQLQNEEFWESREPGVGFCVAMFDYADPSPGDLKFLVGDRIEILEFIGEDWARGRLGNKEGLFPLRFVAEELNSPPHSPEPEIMKKVLAKVVHNFDGETVDDLVIKEGDLVEVGDFADINKNWRWGTLHGKRGMFPADFVHILE